MDDVNSANDLAIIVLSKTPLIIIESDEEARVLKLIRRLAKSLSRPAFSWAVTTGLILQNTDFMVEISSSELSKPEAVLKDIKSHKAPGIYVLCDFHPYLENAPNIIRLIKEISLGYDYLEHSIIFLSHRLELPDELKRFCARFEMPMPDAKAIEKIVYEEAKLWSRKYKKGVRTNKRSIQKLIRNLTGLTLSDARRLARKAIYDDGIISESDIPEVNKAKYKLLNMDGLISFEYETSHFSDVGGLKNLKRWLKSREVAFHQVKKSLTIDKPKGIMLLGVQGCGKSLAAKAAAGTWGLPLLRLDFAILFNKFFGETEHNLRKTLKMAELMCPCVLWIDEIEKGIAAGDFDSGTSRRVLGTLLTWMSERTKPVFIVATSNDISSLPPELVRKGRFDEIFFVDLPDEKTREDIFKIHLSKRDLDHEHFNLKTLAHATSGFSGAEIEQIVVSGLYHAIAEKQSLSLEHLLVEINRTSPLSIVMAEQITALRHWASGRTVLAN